MLEFDSGFSIKELKMIHLYLLTSHSFKYFSNKNVTIARVDLFIFSSMSIVNYSYLYIANVEYLWLFIFVKMYEIFAINFQFFCRGKDWSRYLLINDLSVTIGSGISSFL